MQHARRGALHRPQGTPPPTEPLVPFTPIVELGWRLAHAFWGHGYAQEAARVALARGFLGVGLDEIVSFTAELSGKSRPSYTPRRPDHLGKARVFIWTRAGR